MSTVTKCDRCGTIFNPIELVAVEAPKDLENDAPWRLNLTKDLWPHSGQLTIDLCPNCKASLNDWLVRLVDENGPAAGRR